ncbi:hypothetical protein SAMN05216535_0195 [Stutzerimonas xanthomarina]|uniref:Uncharacterized protein n=2 Tax=Stutzerimonas xanthomarina TaxID=271420 RepID=A0A1M5L729_9GAMM|nr:hypothetical protein SAMN05216535_0195 [Stutzerimonas xanthomarina]SHG60847.1 hypothetical protein SAMN02744645_0897 [Stutzerimonas xanthomarina DSM 18231]
MTSFRVYFAATERYTPAPRHQMSRGLPSIEMMMHPTPSRSREQPTGAAPVKRRHRRQRLISLVYALGLLLVFVLSLLLLPNDAGLGKLLWSAHGAG